MSVRVLLVDDQPLLLVGLGILIGDTDDLEVVGEAHDGHEALRLVRELRPDVVVMDIRMPGMDGIEATRQATAEPDPPKVLVLTTFDDDEYVYGALRAGASGFLLLDRSDDALGQAPATPCRGLVKVRAVRAQLLAMENRGDDAFAELRSCEEGFEALPSDVTNQVRSINSWGEDRLRYTEAFVCANLGELDQLDRAVQRTNELLPPASPRWRVHVQASLLQALGRVRAGDVTGGISHAQEHYGEYPADRRTTMVTSNAGDILQSVPAKQRATAPVRQFQAMLQPAGQRKAIT
jgi:DNA-binding NarL/FixJ family response regulator